MAKEKEEVPNLNKLQELMGGINKMFGTGTIIELGEESKVDIECNPVGVPSIDLCLGGGFPVGRIIEVYGPESSGKTSCTLLAIAEAQKKGHICGFIDVEQALDVNYASSLGVDVSKLVLSQPDYGEAAFEVLDRMIESGLFKIIVFDSIAAVTPKAELEGEMGESKMGVVARLVAQMLRKITAKTKKTNTTVIFINQLREKIGVIYGCLHADMPILFTDGRSIPIRQVVEQKIKGNVLSYNETTGLLEEKPIIAWHYNGKVNTNKDFLHIETESIDGRGRFGVTVTPDHKVLTEKGWKKAKDITINDRCVGKADVNPLGDKKCFVKVVSIRNASDRQIRQKGKYDITVEGNHNYFSGGVKNGIIVHNSNETTPGGNSMKFYASQRIDIRKGPQVKNGDVVIGGTMRFKVVKNKIAPPFKNTELEVLFGHGIDITKDYINVAVSQGIIEKTGSWYKYEGTNIGQGLDKSKDMLLDNPELFEEIKSKIKMR